MAFRQVLAEFDPGSLVQLQPAARIELFMLCMTLVYHWRARSTGSGSVSHPEASVILFAGVGRQREQSLQLLSLLRVAQDPKEVDHASIQVIEDLQAARWLGKEQRAGASEDFTIDLMHRQERAEQRGQRLFSAIPGKRLYMLRGHAGTSLAGSGRVPGRSGGISCQIRPSSRRPPLLWYRPPHCLKKNGTPASKHCWRSSRAQSGFTGRASIPLSPPQITQWSCFIQGERSSGPKRGSHETKRTIAGTSRRYGKRSSARFCKPMDVPIQT